MNNFTECNRIVCINVKITIIIQLANGIFVINGHCEFVERKQFDTFPERKTVKNLVTIILAPVHIT